ncbi:MAG TPA: ABC transporter ATP-binding protein, partial [Rhodopirellula sp.]|nr:ABC transporter ATP-binding protein [Rhodopirellula sp.]
MSQRDELAEVEQSGAAVVNEADRNIVQIERLTKRYGDFTALDDCRLEVVRGEVFGLLGPNGAGKTTLIRLMLGFLQPTSGRCLVDGFDPHVDGVGLRERVAYLPGDARLPRHMRGGGVLKFFAEMHPAGDLERSLEVADRLELQTGRRVGFMSTGMRQKLALSVVLGLATPLLILDEPTANLDPTIRATVLELVLRARDIGRTVILSSHVLSEIEDTCDRVAFLRHGKLAHELTMKDLFQRHRITARQPAEPVRVPERFKSLVTLQGVQQGSSGHLKIDTAGGLAPLLAW